MIQGDDVANHRYRDWPEVIQRFAAFMPGLVTYVVCAWLSGSQALLSWWFFVGLAVFFGAVFVEHHFTSPQDALVNSVASVGMFLSADRTDVEELWWLYLGMALATGVAALVATLPFEGLAKRLVYRWATRFGRVVVLGGGALFIEFVRRVTTDESGAAIYGVGALALILVVSDRWYLPLVAHRSSGADEADATDALGPALVLVEGVSDDVEPGDVRDLGGADGVPTEVLIAMTLPGAQGRNAVVAVLDGDWARVIRSRGRSRAKLGPRKAASAEPTVGVVGAGSTSHTLNFDQALQMDIGQTLELAVRGDSVFYQVVDADLHVVSWDGARQLVPRAVARQIGRIDAGVLRTSPHLPDPHARIAKAPTFLAMDQPSGHVRIGNVEGTGLAIGVSTDARKRGHLAILGMTGMGKTTVVDRLSRAFGDAQPVIALDVTGEYAAKLAWPAYVETAWTTPGISVRPVVGELTLAAQTFLAECLRTTRMEYEAGVQVDRLVVFEEAHGMLPEGNIADWDQKKRVGESTRDIMQARKYGLSFVFVSQRTAVISKSALSQCESYIVLRTLDDTSLSYLEAIAGPIVRAVVPKLARYEALCFGPAFNSENPVIVRLDGAAT